MTLERITKALEYTISEDGPTLDGDWIRGLLVMGLQSKNAWNAGKDNPTGDANGPRRNFAKVCAAKEEYVKLDGLPSYILHKDSHPPEDKLGTFHNPQPSAKGLRMDLLCIKAAESYHPQIVALRDNIEHKRPFGGFSPNFDIEVDRITGAVEHILEAESIDLVPNPASVKSAVESEGEEKKEPEYVKREEHEALKAAHESLENQHSALDERVKALECHYQAVKAAHEAEAVKARESVADAGGVRHETIPPVVPAGNPPASIFDFVRGA
jgi:hypothetical protein